MLSDHLPEFGLRLTTPRLELRLPDNEELAALGEVAAEGIHAPDAMPFTVPWTDQENLVEAVVRFHWGQMSRTKPEEWSMPFVVFLDGRPIGKQDLSGKNYAITREAETGSWLGRAYHGKGIGTEMRAAVLHLAFAGLDAVEAVSAAHADNAASLGVSRKLGYVEDGVQRHVVRDKLMIMQGLRLTREAWERHRTVPVEVHGLEGCERFFGLD